MKNNILILSAGRRVDLVQAFKTEVNSMLDNSSVYAVDIDPNLSPACMVADEYFKSPRINDKSYVDFLKKLCIKKNVGLIIPTIDHELLILSRLKYQFLELGVHIIISNEDLVTKCRNKNLTAILFDRLGIDSPKIYNKNFLEFPCFVKPYDGSSSVGALTLDNIEMLTPQILNNPKNMFMELIPGFYKEYTVDAYYDKSNNLICAVPRLRIETRAGEISKGVTKKNHVYDYLISRLKTIDGAEGCITIQLFVDEDSLVYKAIEINPRFGGGYPLSYSAGANYPAMIIKEYLLNEKLEFYDKWEENLLMLRYDAKIMVKNYVKKNQNMSGA